MANFLTAEEQRQECIQQMGDTLGCQFHALWQEVAWLYSKWAEYLELFGTSPFRVELLNSAAPGFFRIVQDTLWEDTILHIARLTDRPESFGKANLTIRRLPGLVDDAIRLGAAAFVPKDAWIDELRPAIEEVLEGRRYVPPRLPRRGRRGPELDPEYVRVLDRINTRTIDRTGGTILHTSRTNPAKMPRKALPPWLTEAQVADLQVGEDRFDLTPVVMEHIERLGIDVLVTIGGDDTLSFARVLAATGVPLVAIPKTMDNDAPGTEYCIGFSSAITRAKELINRQRTTLGSHERIGVFRVFGRDEIARHAVEDRFGGAAVVHADHRARHRHIL